MSANALKLGISFLFTGTVKTKDGKREVEPGSLMPVRNALVFTRGPKEAKSADQQVVLTTDHKGLLCLVAKDGTNRVNPAHDLGDRRRFFLPAQELQFQAWLADPESWADNLNAFLKQEASVEVELRSQRITKRLLKPPERPAAEGDEKNYADWYDSLSESSSLSGFILPRVRALLLVLDDRSFIRRKVTVTPPGDAQPLEREVLELRGVVGALIVAEEKQLPAGLYTIQVSPKLETDSANWSGRVRLEGAYTLKEMVRFPLQTLAGDFDVLTCGPISVEEAMMTQFAGFYAHLAAAARMKALFPELEDPAFPEIPRALNAWAEQLKWLHAKANLPVKLIQADGKDGENGASKRTRILAKLVSDHLETEDSELSGAKDTIELAFGLKKSIKEFKDLKKELVAEKQIEGLRKLLWEDLEPWDRYRWWKFFKEKATEGGKTGVHLLKLAKASAVARAGILRVGIPQEKTNLHKLLGDGAGTAVPRLLAAAEFGVQVLETASALAQVAEKGAELEELKQDFASLVRQLDEDLARAASREAIGSLERKRTEAVAAHLGLEDAEREALLAALDLALAGLTAVGVGGAGLALVFLAKGLVTDLATWCERVVLKGWLSNFYVNRFKLLSEQTRASHANQDHLRESLRGAADGGANDMEVQFRLRAEALNGLQGLLLRAAAEAESDEAYRTRLEKYRVREYIEHYVLKDGWQMSLRPVVPISLDAAWLHFAGPQSPWVSSSELVQQLGLESPLQAAAVSVLPGANATLVVANELLAGNTRAQFHDTFPIHQLASEFESFADAFRPNWPELDEARIALTRVYWRPSGNTSARAWQPMNPSGTDDADDLPLRSPLDQIRVLVVLHDGSVNQSRPGAPVGPGKSAQVETYPVSLQLWRYDGTNLKGPVYHDFTRRLTADELLEDEKDLVGRLGCVFYPFFQFGPQLVPGTKPLAGPILQGEEVGLYRFLGFLSDMRYGFELRLGRSERGIPVKLGAAMGTECSDLDEYRVSIGGGTDERKLLVGSFLRSRSELAPPLPTLFRWKGSSHVPSYVRVGGRGPWMLADAEPDARVRFPDFNWRDPVEFMVVVAATFLNVHDYEQQGLDWTRVPVTMDLELEKLYVPDGTAGPSYTSKLEYVGELLTESGVLVRAQKPPERAVAEWAEWVNTVPGGLQSLARAIYPPGFLSNDLPQRFRLFAAHFRMSYFTPRDLHGKPSRHVDSLRPWGLPIAHQTSPYPYYAIRLRNLRTPYDAGLNVSSLDAEFHFHTPRSFLLGVPWEGVSVQRIFRWIQKEGTRRIPDVELIR